MRSFHAPSAEFVPEPSVKAEVFKTRKLRVFFYSSLRDFPHSLEEHLVVFLAPKISKEPHCGHFSPVGLLQRAKSQAG
jgi:hypothetical protein